MIEMLSARRTHLPSTLVRAAQARRRTAISCQVRVRNAAAAPSAPAGPAFAAAAYAPALRPGETGQPPKARRRRRGGRPVIGLPLRVVGLHNIFGRDFLRCGRGDCPDHRAQRECDRSGSYHDSPSVKLYLRRESGVYPQHARRTRIRGVCPAYLEKWAPCRASTRTSHTKERAAGAAIHCRDCQRRKMNEPRANPVAPGSSAITITRRRFRSGRSLTSSPSSSSTS